MRVLLEEIGKSPDERKLLPAMTKARVDKQVGVAKEGVEGTRYVDQLVVDMATLKSGKPHVEAYSCKSRMLKGQEVTSIEAIVEADVKEALAKYGRRVEVRRPDHPLFKQEVEVAKVHLVYEAKLVDPSLREAIIKAGTKQGVEVHFL